MARTTEQDRGVSIPSLTLAPPPAGEPGGQTAADPGSNGAPARVNTPVWVRVPGALGEVSVGGVDEVWGIDAAGNVFHFQDGAWAARPGSLTRIAAGVRGAVWGVNGSVTAGSNVYRWTGNGWESIPGLLTQVSAASPTQVWGVNTAITRGDNVFRWNGSGWEAMPGTLTWVSVATDGSVWGVNAGITTGDNVFRWNGSGWTAILGGTFTQVAATPVGVWGVTATGDLFYSNGGAWQRQGMRLANVSAAAGRAWGVDPAGNVWYLAINAPLAASAPRLGGEPGLPQGGAASYLFDLTNTFLNGTIRNVQLQLLFDEAAFADAGVQVAPHTLTVPEALAYGQTVTVASEVLAAAAWARTGTYGFYGVRGSYEIVIGKHPPVVVTESLIPVISDAGGWMTFEVVQP